MALATLVVSSEWLSEPAFPHPSGWSGHVPANCWAPGDWKYGGMRSGLPWAPTLLSDGSTLLQELRTWEEELTRAALQQKNQEELLRRREQELAEREIDILERELNVIIHQLCQEKPRVKKRKGKFRKSRLKLKDGNRISLPSGQWPGTCWEAGGRVCESQGLSLEAGDLGLKAELVWNGLLCSVARLACQKATQLHNCGVWLNTEDKLVTLVDLTASMGQAARSMAAHVGTAHFRQIWRRKHIIGKIPGCMCVCETRELLALQNNSSQGFFK